MGLSTVDSIVKDNDGSTGTKIETVYAKVVPLYAVYRTAERVNVQYADDDALGSEQRRALIESNPVKGEINGLIVTADKKLTTWSRSCRRKIDQPVHG